MPLRGNLQNLRLGDVLQTVLASGGRGLLRVRSGTRRAVLHLSDRGLRVLEPEVLDDRMVLDAFVRRGAVQPDVLERARRLAGKGGDGSVLETLLIGGSIDRQPFDALLGEAAEDAVLDVLAWNEGDFVFDEGAEPARSPGRVAEVSLDPSGLLLRAAQRLDEHAQLTGRIGANALLLMPADGSLRRLAGTPTVVHARLDGQRLLDEIALEAGITLFEARKAAAALVDGGAARVPTGEELAAASAAREAAGDVRAAAALLRQWQATAPDDPAPVEAALALAGRTSSTEDETVALRALGHLHLRANRPAEAHEAFEQLAKKRPGDRDALDGKRQAARAMGDLDEFARSTRTVASADLDADDAPHAADILGELLALRPDDVEARLLRTKALTRAGRRDDAVVEFGHLADSLPKRCTRRLEREAATYARSTLAHLAPEETELLTRFQRMLDAPERSKRILTITAALAVVLAGVGFVLWPASPAALLTEAQTAAEKGELSRAMELLERIQTDHGDSPEAREASSLRQRWTPTTPAPGTSPATTAKSTATVLAAAEKAAAAFPRWPRTDAVAETEALISALRGSGVDGPAARRVAAEKVGNALLEAVTTLRRDAQLRRDALDAIANLAQHPVQNVTVLGEALERARAAMDASWSAQASRAGEAARRLTAMIEGGAVPTTLPDEVRGLEVDVAAATRAIGNRLDDVSKLAREHHRLRVLDVYETARTDGARRLARGDLAAARAELNRLRELVLATEKDPSLRPLLDGLEKRGVTEFLAMRESMAKSIDEGLASALEAERTGNLAGASAQYARLVRQFPQVRFDDVFTIPLRVECVPPSAKVSVNGKAVDGDGSGTMVVRYGWGASATLSVSAEGYEPASVVLDTSAERPRADLAVRLIPARRWAAALPGTVEAPVFASAEGVVVATRAGRLECRDATSGTVRWTVETRCVEGVRGRAALAGDQLLVPLLDGRVARIAMSTGGALPPFQLKERPVGDAAASGNRVAFAMDASLAVFTDGDNPTYIPLPAPTTAGVLSALGAFWIGDATGGITRVDASSLLVCTVRPGGRTAVVGLASDAQRVYALTEDGALHAVGGADQSVAWTRPGLGDVVGNPAVAAGVVAVAERNGRVVLLKVADGSPKGVRETGSPAREGLVAAGDRVVAALADGRLWVYDAAKDAVIVDAPLEGTARIGPAVTDNVVIAPAAGNGIAALPLPK
ncbi:MAG: DUF4388 domain-containing protein [Planctomycetota bacterium]